MHVYTFQNYKYSTKYTYKKHLFYYIIKRFFYSFIPLDFRRILCTHAWISVNVPIYLNIFLLYKWEQGFTRNSRCENAKSSVQHLEKRNMKSSIVGEKRTRQLEYCISFNLLRFETFLLDLLEQRNMEGIVRIIHLLYEKTRFRALCFFIKLSLTLVWFFVLLYQTTEFRYCHLVCKKVFYFC